MNRKKLSEASHARMIRLYINLNRMDEDWRQTVISSAELGELIGTSGENIRKDLNTLGCRASGRGYRIAGLAASLREALHLDTRVMNAGLAGLDSWGALLIRNPESFPGIRIVAAFDNSQNRLERTESAISLYPSYEIREVFEQEKIEIGILASESGDPERIMNRMIDGGIRGLVNLTGCQLNVPPEIWYRQADLTAPFLSIVSRINGVEK
ncbi:MAG: winged-helix domain-containing protein [Spirochaetales bacterium]|nr:winged-helix domain-containing protein [Spirochaetales bacterium]